MQGLIFALNTYLHSCCSLTHTIQVKLKTRCGNPPPPPKKSKPKQKQKQQQKRDEKVLAKLANIFQTRIMLVYSTLVMDFCIKIIQSVLNKTMLNVYKTKFPQRNSCLIWPKCHCRLRKDHDNPLQIHAQERSFSIHIHCISKFYLPITNYN